MKYFYDCEFLEDGETIAPISIGIVSNDGREYYAVFKDGPWSDVRDHEWLMANVVPHLPHDPVIEAGYRWLFNMKDPCVRTTEHIRADVHSFFQLGDKHAIGLDPIELWGYYSAYDHVLLSQLWGRMIDLPRGLPMWTNDIQQLADMWELEGLLPAQPADAHNALADARWTRDAYHRLHELVKGIS